MRLIWGRKTPESLFKTKTMGKVEQNVEERNTKYMALTKREELIPRNSSIKVDKSQWKIRKVAKKGKWSEVRKIEENSEEEKKEQKFIILIQSEWGKRRRRKEDVKISLSSNLPRGSWSPVRSQSNNFMPIRVWCETSTQACSHGRVEVGGRRYFCWLIGGGGAFGRLGLRLVISAVIFYIYFFL